MNYAVYTYQVIDGHAVCRIVAYQVVQDPVMGTGVLLMTKADAEAYAAAITDPSITKMVLPLETAEPISV